MIKKLTTQFLQWFCHPDFYDEIQGDLEEIFQRNLAQGNNYAQRKYLLQVLGLFRLSLMRPFFQSSLINIGMFRSNLKISIRILLRQKFYSAINVFGLAIGMGVCLLIYQYIQFELSYDQFHKEGELIYRITQTVSKNGEVTAKGIDVTHGLATSIKESIPEVKEVVRINPLNFGLIAINEENNERHQEDNIWYVDDNFLELFSFPLKFGSKELVLKGMHNIVLTEKLAQKYFGNINPVGKELRISGGVLTSNFIVTGVLEKLPENTHLQFDLLMPMQFVLKHWRIYERGGGWEYEDFAIYAGIDKTTDIKETALKVDKITQLHLGEELKTLNIKIENGFQPIEDIHLKSAGLLGEIAKNNGNIKNVTYFAIIGLFILVIAWINYVNLSTARAMHRAKEVGVRKSIGAQHFQLVSQFLVESVLINSFAAILAFGITYFLLPILGNIIGKSLYFTIIQEPSFWISFMSILFLGSLLSGIYPAFVLSSFKPISALKSVKSRYKNGLNLRKGLIVFQFFISVLLISGTYLVYKQITYMKSKELGFEMEKILVVNGPLVVLEENRESLAILYQKFRTESQQHHTVKAISATSNIPSNGYNWSGSVWKPGQLKEEREIGFGVFVDTAFLNTYEMEFLTKGNIPNVIHSSSEVEYYFVNEEAVRKFNLGSPEDALGQKLIIGGDTITIEGVVNNMHWSSPKEEIKPTIYGIDNLYGHYFSVNMNLANIPESIAHVEKAFKNSFPEDPFEYYFLDDDFNNQYQADLQFGNLFSAFSILAIVIACLGLFALVSYSATLKIKEIGIRKVLGASIGNLMILLSREYLMLLVIAILLAIPLVAIGGNNWLDNYAFKTSMSSDLFLIPPFVLVFIAVFTVSYRTYKSAKANPVNALKKE
ncbi:MAG: ABC transporter permease [Flammeovirgaceae bacterium]|nr:ABC transporter permease [Flammeovirgaceae bacterium]